jgi:hypothetical protein
MSCIPSTHGRDIFTRFPELPTDLRLRIWRSLFPGPSKVFLLPRIPTMAFPHIGGRQGSLPATLCINHESRQETLRHYVVFPGIHKSDSDRSMCLNPRIDSVHVTLDRLIWANSIIPTYGQWLKELSTRLPDLLGSIKTLEIHDHDCVMQKDTSDVLYYIKHEMQVLSFFTGLKEVGF